MNWKFENLKVKAYESFKILNNLIMFNLKDLKETLEDTDYCMFQPKLQTY